MERHKSLYKDNSVMLSPKINRVKQRNAIRAKERNERFCAGRNIQLSPGTPAKNATIKEENKENIVEPETLVTKDTTKIARVACSRNGKEFNRQEKYLHRFIEWRQMKKKQEEMKKSAPAAQKQPFVPVGTNSGSNLGRDSQFQSSAKSTFYPKNHKFKPPQGLKNPVSAVKPSQVNEMQRQSIYSAAPTPEKRKKDPVDVSKKFNLPRRALPSSTKTRPVVTLPSGVSSNAVPSIVPDVKTQAKRTLFNGVETKTKANIKQPPIAKPTNLATKKQTTSSAVDGAKKLTSARTEVQPFIKPTLKLPSTTLKAKAGAQIIQPVLGGGGRTAKIKQTGAVGKVKAAAVSTKRPCPIPKPKPNLAVSMKAKKNNSTVSTRKTSVNTKQPSKKPAMKKLNKQQLLEFVDNICPPIVETQSDLVSNPNPFGTMVTSTQRKSQSSSHSTFEFLSMESQLIDSISPIESSEKVPSGESGKTAVENGKVSNKKPKSESVKKKFNFVRYDVTPSKLIDEIKTDEKEETPLKPLMDITANDSRPLNYLSPYVSVARGKVNAKIEKEKRNSIYLLNNVDSPATQNAKTNDDLVATRRTLETVRYFRKQLSDEIKRLHDICDKWETYKSENLVRLQETGGDDMINVTIGQTKLLTSKKFMQFSGLIDRCEKGASAPHLMINDGSEDTKPITAVDLEGFWSMIGLQVDNVDKRFLNLDRWRDNDWLDPDNVQEKAKQIKTRKIKKSGTVQSNVAKKAKPTSDLQQLIRKMHADMRKKKAEEAAAAKNTDGAVPEKDFTSSSSKRRSNRQDVGREYCMVSSPGRRVSIIIKNRRFHSPAPTILKMNTPTRRSSTPKNHNSNSSQLEPMLLNSVKEMRKSLTNLQTSFSERNELLLSALKGAEQKRRTAQPPSPSPALPNTPLVVDAPKVRKSILKTPGTAKGGNPKSVIFNKKLQIKKYKFTIDSDQSDSDEKEIDNKVDKQADEKAEETADDREEITADENEGRDERTYRLRSRKVVLRPSCEFEIP